ISMYDASLDAIRSHLWTFTPSFNLSIPYTPRWNSDNFIPYYASRSFEVKTINEKNILMLNELNWFGLSRYMKSGSRFNEFVMRGVLSSELVNSRIGTGEVPMVAQADVVDEVVVMAFGAQRKESVVGAVSTADMGSGSSEEVKIRANFNETAFFYPQLQTDKDGNIKFSFTVPESLTKWNVKMLAHTCDLFYGSSESQTVTQKELMVQLNMPRFVRRSDKLTLMANVVNLTEETLSGNVRFELIDPETEKPIALKDNTIHNVTLAAGETKAVAWGITEFSGYELVTAKVIAQAGAFSDGEQHFLPVLPDKVVVTESMPLAVRGKQTRNFRFESLLNRAKNVESKSLSIEFSSNPVWYAVQALPTLSAPQNENAIDYFTAFYANSLASYMANATPKLAAVFDLWKKEQGGREALLSSLEKNSELKNMLLEETPWVMAAQDETEQKRRIALLFDLNRQKNQSQKYFDKLVSLQKPSGGFSWFEGMGESRYITQTILMGMARYYKMTNTKDENPEWLKRALYYVDQQISRDFEALKKNNKDFKTEMCIGDMQWFYLHMRSFYFDFPVSEAAAEAKEYYTSQAEKYWTQATLYGKAATAIISHRNGKTTLVGEILESLKENALKTDEMGMYWARNTAGYFWNERPVSVQTAILEAFAEAGNDENAIEEMKIWLLKQKQAQRWDSPISTADAVYALLNYGDDWLAGEGKAEIKINGKKVEAASREAGTGYFKKTIPGAEVTAKMGNVSVKKEDAGIGWGAVYWQYYQDVDKVEVQGGALSVTKKLFVEKTEGNKTSMIPIEQAQVTKGDRIITRLVITTDRNLEFVAMKDLRAACFEPADQRSGMVWRESVAYYETTKDASTQFFFNFLPKGTYTFEYVSLVNNTGDFANGMSTIQCQYAPEFLGHSGSSRVVVE
ncbi:MAG: hypothetical protein FWG22_03025, partial [Prolixibacteraceae bacterium]|nr:hypothetical protein [Prolixibacteraceae bacterium]